ncbi:MAG TPA: fibronectin type III domain-containing protein, partial [Verrucomicrobiae bacterium]|nr:fibronectin type III domain-containing protein [Verrucomicrobiae bacterium]
MNARPDWRIIAVAAVWLLESPRAPAQAIFSDSFAAHHNYLTNGLAGTLWDGVYFAAGDFDNTGLGGGGPGATVQCDADLTAAGTLSVQTTGTAWEGGDDDGFYLFKIVPGDFSMSVHVVSPYNNSAYNTAGLQARAFGANGDPPGGSENFVSWTRFDEYSFANYLRSEVNGGVAQINPGDFPNTNYWLRMDRVGGTNFYFYQKSTKAGVWQPVTFPAPVNGAILRRLDLAGKPLQAGIIHATYNGLLGVQFTDFSLAESNVAFAAAPSAPTGLMLATNANGLMISWSPAVGAAGSLVMMWTGTNVMQEMPADGFAYSGNGNFGFGSSLAGAGYFAVYNGSGTNVLVDNLVPNTTYQVAVFSYSGSGNSIAYNHAPITGSITVPPNEVLAQVNVENADVAVTFTANPGEWY